MIKSKDSFFDEDIDSVKKYCDFYEYNTAAINYATLKGTTRIPEKERYRRGQGLYYVKLRTLEFKGECRIRSANASVKYFQNGGGVETHERKPVANMPGNLITITLPLIIDNNKGV